MELTDRDEADFRARGFCVKRAFFSPDEIASLSRWLEQLKSPDCAPTGEARYYEQSPATGEGLLVRVEHIVGPHTPGISPILMGPRVLAACGRLLGDAPVLFKEKANYKLPGCRPDKLHQDQAAGWNAYADFFITLAIAIDPNRADNAALSFLASGAYPRDRLMGPEWEPLTDADPPWEPRADYQLIEADPGDVVFFDSYVPHGSPANESDRQRRNIYLTFNRQAAGDLRERYYREKWASYPPNDPGHVRRAASYRV